MDLIETLGLGKCVELLRLADQYGSNSTHCHTDSNAFFCDHGEKGFYIYLGPASIANAADSWDKSQLTLIQDIRDAVAECSDIKEFEGFLNEHGHSIRKHPNGVYGYATRLVLEEWVKSPELALAKIQKLKNTTYSLQGKYA